MGRQQVLLLLPAWGGNWPPHMLAMHGNVPMVQGAPGCKRMQMRPLAMHGREIVHMRTSKFASAAAINANDSSRCRSLHSSTTAAIPCQLDAIRSCSCEASQRREWRNGRKGTVCWRSMRSMSLGPRPQCESRRSDSPGTPALLHLAHSGGLRHDFRLSKALATVCLCCWKRPSHPRMLLRR